jgi:DNA-binding response OmpR family regulator
VKKRILVVEDDEALASVLCHNLEHEGFEVKHVANGTPALSVARAFAPDLVLLDLLLPGVPGLDLCASWQTEGRFPVIIITARDRKEDKLRGLKAGADDYLTKPFDLDELLARVHIVLRRRRPAVLQRLKLGDIVIDFTRFTARRGHRSLNLTRREFDILRYLAGRGSTVIVYRDELLRNVWGVTHEPFSRAVDRAIARLRTKIESDPHRPSFIHTAHGDGYYLTADL